MSVTVTEPVVTPDELAELDPAIWAQNSEIFLANGEMFSFEERPYLIQPMRSRHRKIVVMKAAQLGFSEIFILRELHACIYGLYKQGSLYLFPNADEMRKFSQSRFNTLINANKMTIGKFVKSGGKGGTDTANLKRVGNANLFLDGATLTQSIGDNIQQKESAALRGKSVDSINFDEYDLMDSDIITNADSRLKNSDVKRITVLSNPSIPDYQVSGLFNLSNQNQWFRKCSACGEWSCPDMVFPDFIEVDKYGKGYCACQSCGEPLPLGIYAPDLPEHSCEWRAQRPDNKEWEGYNLSTLNHPRTDPYEVKVNYEKAKLKGGITLTNFYKFDLGQPYVDSQDQLTPPVVYDCCGHDVMVTSSIGPCAMGIDVMKEKYCVIGQRTDRERWEVVRAERVETFDDALTLIPRYGIKSCVVDIRPYEEEARGFQKKALKLGCKVYLCEYSENPMEEAVWNDKDKVVRAFRCGLLDISHRMVSKKQVRLPKRCAEIDLLVKQMCSMAKTLVTKGKANIQTYDYISTSKEDHYRHTMGYFYLAASGSKIAVAKGRYSEQTEPQFVVNDTERYI